MDQTYNTDTTASMVISSFVTRDSHEFPTDTPKSKTQATSLPWYLIISFLLLTMTLSPGMFYTVDFPQALSHHLILYFEINNQQLLLNYTLYNFANLIATPICAIVIPKIGISNSLMILCFMTFVGQTLSLYSINIGSYDMFIVARIIYAIGAENLFVGWMGAIEMWFGGSLLSVASGINVSFGQLFGIVGNYIPAQQVHDNRNMQTAYFWGAVLCFLSSLGACIYAIMETLFKSKIPRVDIETGDKPRRTAGNLKDLLYMGKSFWGMCLIYCIVALMYF